MAKIDAAVKKRFRDLISNGENVLRLFSTSTGSADASLRPAAIAWLYSAANLLELATPSGSPYQSEATRLRPKATDTIFKDHVAAMLGLVESASQEYNAGLLVSLESRFVALAFGDFLRHASEYLEQGKTTESAILASAVLEDSVKRLCRNHGIDVENATLDPLITALKNSDVIGKVQAQRLRAYAAVRNQAAHANWEAIDDASLRQMIEGIEELVEIHLER